MVNRRAFFEIFFYNRPERTREMMEAAEGVWRAYMKKYGLGLDAGTDGQPTYDEVREISYLANAAIEAVEKQIAEAEAEEAKRKKLQKEAWDLGIYPPADMATAELEAMVLRALNPVEEPAEETVEEVAEETVEEAAEETAEEVAEEVIEEAEVVQQVAEPVVAEIVEEPVAAVEAPAVEIPQEKNIASVNPMPVAPAGKVDALTLWVDGLKQWCNGKGMQCITTIDEGDCYLHVYFPHKKDVYTVGKWCFKANTNGAELAAEMTKLFAYCQGYADCFERIIK